MVWVGHAPCLTEPHCLALTFKLRLLDSTVHKERRADVKHDLKRLEVGALTHKPIEDEFNL